MNDTNNSSENNVSNVPVQNAVSGEQPVAQNTESVQSVQSENTSVIPSGDNGNNNNTDGVKVEEEKKEAHLSKTEEEVRNAKLRFPIIVTVLVAIFLILILLYCFVFTTPDKVYTKILKTSVDKIVGLVDFHNTSDEFTNTEASIIFDTKSVDFESKDILSHIDGLTYKVKFNRDNKNKNFEFILSDNIKDLDGKSLFKYGEPINSKMYYIDSNIYSKLSKNYISVRSNTDKNENESVFNVVSEYLYEVINNLNIDKVERDFTTKKVNDQTLLAVKYQLKYDNADLKKLSEVITNNILDTGKHPDFIKKLSNLTDMDEKTIKDSIKSLSALTENTKNVEFNYYVNISFTNLICLEMITDNGVFSLSYLNDYYYIDYESKDKSVDLDLTYNFDNLDTYGTISIDSDAGKTYLTIDSNYELDDEMYKLYKNNIIVNVYDDKGKKPYMSITIDLKHDYTDKTSSLKNIKSIKREEASDEDISILEYNQQKISYELSYLLMLFTQNKLINNPKDVLDSMINDNTGSSSENSGVDVPVVDENVDNTPQVSTPSE